MKRQASAIAAIFQDPELLQKGEDYANNAAGATAKAMDTVLDTIEVRISRLQNEAQTFWQELINSNDVKKLIDGLSTALKLTNSLVTASHGLFNGNGTAGLLGLLAGSTQSAFNKLRNGANSSGGLISFTGTGTYVGGVKLGKSGAASYSSVMGNDGLVYSADDMAAIAKVSKALHEASSASSSFDDALQKSGIDLAALSDNGKSLIATMKNGTAGADELVVRSQSLAKGFNASGEALKAFGRSILSSLASGLVMAGISVAISAIASAVDNYVHRLDTAIDKGKEFSQSIQQQTKQYSDNQDQIESLREEYTSLSRGVDEHGKNVSLTADQYKRYKEIVAQIVQLSPELAKGYSDENGYLVDRNKLIDDAIAKQKEYTAEVQRSRFSSGNFATEMNAQLATVQQSKQTSIKGQKNWFERVASSQSAQAIEESMYAKSGHRVQLQSTDIYVEAQKDFINQLQKLYDSSSNSTEKTLDEYLQSQFSISGATLDNADKIAKSIDKITSGLKPQNDSQATQFNNQITALDKAATNWVKDAETVDSVNQAVRDNFTSFVENAVAGYDKLNDAQKNAIRNSISNLTYADILKGNKTEQDQSILYGTWQVDDSKRRQQQDKYADMVKLLQDSAVQRTMSNASKIDTSLNYADYEKQYKQNLKKIEKVLNSVNASEGLSLKPADIKQLITLTPVDQDGNDLHADPQAMVDRLKATLVNGENLVKDMTLDQINITYPIVQEFAEEHPGLKVDLDQAKRLVNLQVRIEELKNKSVASYSNLKTQVESYTTALGGLNDITANNQIITTDMYNALQSAGVGVEDLNSVVREFGVDSEGYTTYLVENIDKLKEFTKVANDAAKTDISANIDAQRRRYAELVEQLDQVIGENYDYVKSNHTLTESRKDDVRSIQEQLDQTEDLLDSYAALQSQVSATANAYSAYQKAKEYDSRTDFGSEAVEMVSELANDLANATYGTEAFKSAMNAIVPKSALTNMDDAIQRIKDTQKYLNSLDSQHYFTKSDDGALQGLNYETFVKNGLKSQNGIQVFTGTEGNFRLSDTITDIQQVEKAFGMTLPMVQAFDEALKRAGVTSRSMFASLSGDDSQNQIYRTLQNLNDAENQLQEAINQGVDTAPFKKKVDDAKADIDDLANGARQRVSDYLNAMDQMNELDVRGGTEGQREALEAKLNQKPTQLDVELVDKNLDSEIETLQNGAKQKKIELYAKINHVDASNVDSDTVDKWAQNRLSRDLELKKNSSIFLDDESNAAQSEMDKLTQSLDSVKSSSGDLVKSLDNTTQAVNNLSSVMSGGSSSGVKSEGAKNSSKQTAEVNVSNATANKNIKQTEDAGAKLYDIINNGFASINLKNQDALSKVASFKNAYLDAVNTVNQNPLVMQAETGIAFTKSGSGGVSKKKGKAKANGGIVNGESRALVGELGQELVVNPNTGKYYTVGDSGAEFVSLPKNAIVFNHLQTKQLLGGNHTGSRGTALASGNAYVDSSGGNNGILGAFTTTLTPTTDKSSKATSAAKSAGKEISKAAKEAADDWVTAFKNAAEKLRNNYTSGKMDAEQYFDALTKLYQQYYDGYGRKSDENLKKLKDAWTAIYNTEASDLDTKRSNGEITERQYLDGLRNLYKRFYGDLNVYAKEYADAQKDFAQKAKSAYQNVLQAGSSVVSHQIKQLQNQMNGAVSALQAQKDAADRSFEMQLRPLNAEIKHYEKLQKALNKQIKAKTKEQNAIEKVITAKNKEISAIQEAAQARQTDLDLQKAQYELARAEHQRTQYTYTSDKGFVYRSNPTSVKDARENLKEKTENSRVQQINNEINALTKEKEAIQDEIDKIQEVIDRYADKIDAIQEQIDAIQELKDATDQYYDDAIYNIQQQYQTQIDALQKIQDMWDQASDMFDFATSLQLLESFGLSLSDVTNNAGASIDLVKGKLADVLAYIYQNNDAAKQVWSTILGIDLSQITPNIDNFALGIKGVSDYASMASGNVRSLNGDLSAAQMSGMMAQGGLIGAANAATQLGTAASTTSPQELANTMAQLSATDMTGFSNAIGSLTANAASLDALNASLTQTLAIMQGLGAQDTFGALYNQFVAFVTNFEALANQFQQDMTVLFGQGQAAGNDKNSQSAGWFDGFVQQVEDMNERTSAALQNQIEQWTNFQQLMVGVLGVDGNGGGDKGGEGGQGQQSGDGGGTASSGSASADSIIGSLILAATEMNEAFMKWEETLNEFIVGEGGFTDFTNQVMEMITNMANTIKEQCEAAISAINEMVEAVASANAALANMSFSVGSSGTSHPAHAAGAPTGLKHDEHHALVGELGPETVVSGDKYRVVGKHGAELVNLKRGDIVLNHQQTARLFKSGAAHASGIGNLIPAGQPAFMNKLANISSNILSANMKQLTPRLFTGVNVKLAAADGGGTSVTIKDLHVSLPNFNSDKADDLIRDLSSMTLKAVQKYNRH